LLQARRGAAAKGAYRRCCRSSTMSGIACVAARPSRKNVNLFLCDPLVLGKAAAGARCQVRSYLPHGPFSFAVVSRRSTETLWRPD